ncbi:MAG: heavy-metal-associated domain-containing protein [Azoarcus sp.]|jgi:copper chaperone|nr:heavy-metal-associated domain-containing protein [Azoarcus sp.]
MREATLKIEGMTCNGCARNVAKTLEALPGVAGADVSLEQSCAVVRYDPAAIDEQAMRRAVEDAGFDAPQ